MNPLRSSSVAWLFLWISASSAAQVQLPDAVLGRDYNVQLPASGGIEPYRWQAVGEMPPGLTLSRSGLLHGSPSYAGPYDFEVSLTDADDAIVTESVSLTVNEPLPERMPLRVLAEAIPDGLVGREYGTVIPVEGGIPPYTFDLVSPPDGMDLDSVSGHFSGVPVEDGEYHIDVGVSDSQQPPERVSASIRFAAHHVEIIDEPTLGDKVGELPKYLFLALLVAAYFLIQRFVLEKIYNAARRSFLSQGGEFNETEEGVFLQGEEAVQNTLIAANERFRRQQTALRVTAGVVGALFLIYLLV